MVRLLSAAIPSVCLLALLLTLPPKPTSAVTIRDIISSAFGSWSSPEVKDDGESRRAAAETEWTEEDTNDDSDARSGEDAEMESVAEEEEMKRAGDDDEEVEKNDEDEKNDTKRIGEEEQEDRNSHNHPASHGNHVLPVLPVHTVFATLTHYVQVTSTKRQIPMCVTAHVPLPSCSPPPHEESRPHYPWWRTARNRPVSEEVPDKSAEEDSGTETRAHGNPLQLLNPLNLLSHLNPFQHLFPSHKSNTTESPKPLHPLSHLIPFKDTHLHVHFEKDSSKDPLNPNNPAHPLNPAHASNAISAVNGLLSAATGFVGAFTGPVRDGIRVGGHGHAAGNAGGLLGGHPGGLLGGHPGGQPGGHHLQHVYYPRVITELVTTTSLMTKVVTSMDSYLTATVVAQNCLPNSDTISHCHPATTVPYQQYSQHAYQIPNPPYEAYYQQTPVSGGAAPVEPSAWLMASPYLARQTPPLSMREPSRKSSIDQDVAVASNEVEGLDVE